MAVPPRALGSAATGRRNQLPAFCRTRRPITTTVQVSALQQLLWLLWVVLALQLSTLLLVLAGPVPPQPVSSPNSLSRSAAGSDAAELPPVTPLAER